jgi:preprotein translocase subunit SecY
MKFFSSLANIFKLPELRDRVLFTLGIIAVVRLGAYLPTPGVDGEALLRVIEQQAARMGGNLLMFMDMFTGGAMQRCTLFALGIMPYISASIILQLLIAVIPSLEKIAREGEAGQKKIREFTRYGTLFLSLLQAVFIARFLSNPANFAGVNVVPDPGFLFYVSTTLTLTSGTMFLMWLGEQITDKGIGNGISLIITVNILSRVPTAVNRAWSYLDPGIAGGWSPIKLLVLFLIFICVTLAVVMLTQGERRIPVQYAKRVIGRKQYMGQATSIPFRVNYAGVIPIIFASSLLLFPATISGFMGGFTGAHDSMWASTFGAVVRYLSPPSIVYYVFYVVLIIVFCFFWTATQFNPIQMAEDLRRNSAFVPGIRPGKATSDFFDKTMTRITLPGAIFLALIAIIPDILTSQRVMGLNYDIANLFGGTSLLIIVGVTLDTMRQIEAHLLARHYEGFMQRGRIRGRSTVRN